jgi:tRNA pseudouridine55 synthase
MGRKRNKGRDISGILVIDKPKGETSNKTLQNLKNIFFAQKAGHTGSLDPLATGILPICFGEATKFAGYLLNGDKAYRFVIHLGVTTTTGDAEGDILETKAVKVSDKELKKIVKNYIGSIEQTPPMYSAIKINGEKLYKLARKGIEVERKKRSVEIFSLEVVERDGDFVTLEVECSKGTYVRTLAEDIGRDLGCGGSIAELRRIYAEPFDLEDMVSMDKVEAIFEEKDFAKLNALLLPIDAMLGDYPEIVLDDDSAYYVNQGQAVQVSNAPESGKLRMYKEDDSFLGMGRIDEDGKVCPDRLLKLVE